MRHPPELESGQLKVALQGWLWVGLVSGSSEPLGPTWSLRVDLRLLSWDPMVVLEGLVPDSSLGGRN